ncbi:hypothetical protein R4645_10920 [Acinetobacter baumannii]|nr:hypothetical protein [Acinetobacter baumannii]
MLAEFETPTEAGKRLKKNLI